MALKDWKRVSWGTTKQAFKIESKKGYFGGFILGSSMSLLPSKSKNRFLVTAYKNNTQRIYKILPSRRSALAFAKKYAQKNK